MRLILVTLLLCLLGCGGNSNPNNKNGNDNPNGELQDAEVAKKAKQSVRNRIKRFVEHQTFLLASPFVGIFVYQAVREGAGAETQVLAVAIAALGAGPTLNLLLKKGEQAAKFGIERAAGRIPSADEQPPVPPSEQ